MIHHRRGCRILALCLMLVGGLLMLFSTSVGPGLASFSLGVMLEVVGLMLDRRKPDGR
jgi:hypothetical protein